MNFQAAAVSVSSAREKNNTVSPRSLITIRIIALKVMTDLLMSNFSVILPVVIKYYLVI